jgi:hypothetical protein
MVELYLDSFICLHGMVLNHVVNRDNFTVRMWGCGLVSADSEQGPVTGVCEHDNEPFGFYKGKDFLEKL